MECTKVNCPMQAGTKTDNCGENCPWRTTAKTGDLISRAAALEVINAVKGVTWSQSGKVLCGKMYSQIKDLPAVDAVPVIRCRDCKYFMEHNDGQGGNCNHLDYDGEYEFSVAGDWFCADGERRDSE